MYQETIKALTETILMVSASGAIGALLGLPLGVLLSITRKGQIWENIPLQKALSVIVNATRSIPFIILMLALIPFTKAIVGTSIGMIAAIVPLAVAAIPFLARIVETHINEVPYGLIDAGKSMGATQLQIVRKIMLPEASAGIVDGLTLTLINLVGYSAMAGAIGGGGLGSLAYNYGYKRFDSEVMLVTVIVLIILVQLIQSIGDYVVHKILSH